MCERTSAPLQGTKEVAGDRRVGHHSRQWAKDRTLNGVLGKLRDAGALSSLLDEEETDVQDEG